MLNSYIMWIKFLFRNFQCLSIWCHMIIFSFWVFKHCLCYNPLNSFTKMCSLYKGGKILILSIGWVDFKEDKGDHLHFVWDHKPNIFFISLFIACWIIIYYIHFLHYYLITFKGCLKIIFFKCLRGNIFLLGFSIVFCIYI